MQSLRLKIGGMHCDGCAATIKSLLEREAGVRMADVSLQGGHRAGSGRHVLHL